MCSLTPVLLHLPDRAPALFNDTTELSRACVTGTYTGLCSCSCRRSPSTTTPQPRCSCAVHQARLCSMPCSPQSAAATPASASQPTPGAWCTCWAAQCSQVCHSRAGSSEHRLTPAKGCGRCTPPNCGSQPQASRSWLNQQGVLLSEVRSCLVCAQRLRVTVSSWKATNGIAALCAASTLQYAAVYMCRVTPILEQAQRDIGSCRGRSRSLMPMMAICGPMAVFFIVEVSVDLADVGLCTCNRDMLFSATITSCPRCTGDQRAAMRRHHLGVRPTSQPRSTP